jgi:hypothetical protein
MVVGVKLDPSYLSAGRCSTHNAKRKGFPDLKWSFAIVVSFSNVSRRHHTATVIVHDKIEFVVFRLRGVVKHGKEELANR